MKILKITKNKQNTDWYDIIIEDQNGDKHFLTVFEASSNIKELYMLSD